MQSLLHAEGERRRVTVSFSDLSGYTALSESLDPEDVADVLERIKAAAHRIIEAHGGTINQFVGDEIMSVYGAPAAHEDDPRRAVAAAFELHRAVREMAQQLSGTPAASIALHTGIQTGQVLVRPGAPRGGLYDITGDTVNVASRLAKTATRDQVVVGAPTFEEVSSFYVGEAYLAELKGKAQPVLTYRITREVAGSAKRGRKTWRGIPRLVGRSRELETLMRSLELACHGEGSVVYLAGEAGIGKSRVIEELGARAAARGVRVVRGQCRPFGHVVPYEPFAQALREALELDAQGSSEVAREKLAGIDPELAPVAPALLRLLGPWFDDALSTSPAEELGEAIAGGIALTALALTRARPLLLVLEDFHWADESSLRTLQKLCARAHEHALLVVVSVRRTLDLPLESGAARTVELEPLHSAETAELTRLLLAPVEVSDAFVRALHVHTAGNPFFLEEVLRSLVERGTLESLSRALAFEDERALLPAPQSVQSVISARLDLLEPEDAAVLHIASVIGLEFAKPLLTELCGGASLERLEQADLLTSAADDPSRYRFKHAITRDVVYETMLRRRRRELHERVAEAIERSDPISQRPEHLAALSHHFAMAELYARAVPYALRAGDAARASFSLGEAREQYRRALDWLDRLEPTRERYAQRVRISFTWAASCVFKPEREHVDVLRVSRHYAEQAVGPGAEAQCLYWMGWIAHALGNQQEAVEYAQRGHELAREANDLRLASQLTCNIGLSYAVATQYDTALEYLERGIAERRELSAAEPRRSGSPLGETYAYCIGYLGLIHGDRGDFERSEQLLDDALRLLEMLGQTALQGSVYTQRAIVRLARGDLKGCIEAAARVSSIGERIHGSYIRAMAMSADAFARFRQSGDANALPRLRDAAEWLDERETRLTLSWNYALAAEAFARAGDLEAAMEYGNRALARVPHWDGLGEAAAHRALALATARGAGLDAAAVHLEYALAASARKGTRPDAAITRLCHAELLVEAGDRSAARTELERVVPELEAMGMTFYVSAARALMG